MVTMTRLRLPSKIPLAESFVGAMDLKLGVSIISLFAVLNKVAGAYGIMAVFTGGTPAQLTLYLYSIGTIVVFLWGLKTISEEHGPKTLIYAHLFAIDHMISTVYTTLFAVAWYVYEPHDGRRVANSDAQREMMEEAGKVVDEVARKAAAQAIWKSERGFAAAVIVLGWMVKVYFILCLYSFALHLRRGTYHSLPLSRPISSRHARTSTSGGGRYSHLRGLSVATDAGTETTLAQTLWEDEESAAAFERAEEGENPTSPAAARGTGMSRSPSGGTQLTLERPSPFATILGKLNGEKKR